MPFNKLAMKSELSMIKYSRLRGEVMVNDLRVLDDFLEYMIIYVLMSHFGLFKAFKVSDLRPILQTVFAQNAGTLNTFG